jgi:hypothetical protein
MINQLITSGHIVKDTMNHSLIAEFIKPWMKKKNVYTRIYNYTNFFGLFLVGIWAGLKISAGEFTFGMVNHFFLGAMLGFLMIPVHEGLHGIAYKMMGAESVQYRANWRKLVFYAAANGFPAGFREFRFIALLPFSVITTLGLMIMFWSGFGWAVVMSGFILGHAACCGGDFGLLSYMHEHRDLDVITIDDMEKGETFFLVRELNE